MSKITAAITAVGGYVPEYVLSNKELETMVDTNDEWITARTGIKERRILKDKDKGTSFLAIEAAKNLLQKNNTDPKEIDMVIMATATPDMPVAVTGAYVATQIGADNAFSYDLMAACSSFLFGMSIAAKYIESGSYKKVLLVGADKMSSIIDYKDRTTCIIFGDGAGAALFEPNFEGLGVQDEYLRTDGNGRDSLKVDAGGSLLPPSIETVNNNQHVVYQDGKTVFKFAVKNMAEVSKRILDQNQLTGDDIKLFIPHQANQRIIDAAAKRCGLDKEKVFININKYGNTTAGTIPIALDEAVESKRLTKDDILLLAAFGGGFTWGSMLIKWSNK